MHLITLLIEHSRAKISVSALVECQVSWMTLMVELLIINVTLHTPHNRVSDTLTHVTLNTINGALRRVPLTNSNVFWEALSKVGYIIWHHAIERIGTQVGAHVVQVSLSPGLSKGMFTSWTMKLSHVRGHFSMVTIHGNTSTI